MKTRMLFQGGGLNSDDHISAMPEGDYANASNIAFLRHPNEGVGASTFGFSKLFDFGPRYKVIGKHEDDSNSRVFYFLAGLGVPSQIRVVYTDTGASTAVITDDQMSDSLRLLPDLSITGTAMIGDTLFWTDGFNEPAAINTKRALERQYSTPSRFDFLVLKRPPLLPLSVSLVESTSVAEIPDQTVNLLRNHAFQFAYRYVYEDGQVSPLSPYSVLIRYDNDDLNTFTFDAVSIAVPSNEEIPKLVTKVQYAVRKSNTGSWYLIEEENSRAVMNAHNEGSDQLNTFFLNTKTGQMISDEESARPFDLVPLTANALEVGLNRLFLGGITYGYDLFDFPKISMGIKPIEKTVATGATSLVGQYHWVFIECRGSLGGINPFNKKKYDKILVRVTSTDPLVAGYYVTPYKLNKNGYPAQVTITPSNLLILDTAVSSFRDVIDAFAASIGNPCDGRGGIGFADLIPIGQANIQVFGLGSTSTFGADNNSAFKCDSAYQLGIVFFDHGGRTPGVITDKSWVFSTVRRKFTQDTYISQVEYSLGNEVGIPLWATHAQIVRTKSSRCDFFLQTYCPEVKYVNKADDGTISYVDTYDGSTTFAIAWSIERLAHDSLGYQFAQGDILYAANSDDSAFISLAVSDQVGKWVFTKASDLGVLNVSNPWSAALIELYKPKKLDFNQLFYEVGEAIEIIGAGTVNPMFAQKIGQIDGDIYLKERETGAGDIGVEVMSLNDSRFSDWAQDTGRAWIVPTVSQNKLLTSGCYSGAYVQDSAINGTSTFLLLDRFNVDERNGPIRKLVYTSSGNDYGSVMLAICETETSSMYLGKSEITDQADRTILATTGRVVGEINNLRGSMGTIHPETVVENDGRVYWFDAISEKVVRYGPDGLTDIAEANNAKMKNAFRSLAQYARSNRSIKPNAAYDGKTENYLLSFPAFGLNNPPKYIKDRPKLVAPHTYFAGTYTVGTLNASTWYQIFIKGTEGSVELFFNGRNVLGTSISTKQDLWAKNAGPLTIVCTGRCDIELYEYPTSYEVIVDGREKTFAFSEITKRWETTYPYYADAQARINNQVVLFSKGAVYLTNPNNGGMFLKGLAPSSITYAHNAVPAVTYASIAVRYQAPDLVYLSGINDGANTFGATDLEKSDFRNREDYFSADFLRDKYTPGFGDYNQALRLGNTPKGMSTYLTLQWIDLNICYGASVNFDKSLGNNHV